MADAFQNRIKRVAPWILEDGYLFDSPKMRKERFIHVLEYGTSCLTFALERVVS